MAITTSYQKDILSSFNKNYWKSVDEYEEFWLRRISETRPDRNYYTDRDGNEKEIDRIDHHPELKEYEVWMSGYAATGESATARLLGKVKARNFAQACHIIMCKQHLEWMEKENQPDYKQYTDAGRWDYDPTRLTVWGCSLYWNEELARKSFG